MEPEKLVLITISVPKSCRNQLRKIIAQSNLKNPDQVTSLSELGREIFLTYLKSLNEEQAKGNASDNVIPITNKGGE